MERKGIIIGFILIVIVIALGTLANYTNRKEHKNVLITSLVTQQEIHGEGDKDKSSISTTYRYLVNTNIGTFYISPDGLYHSKCFGSLKENKTYDIVVRGYSAPIIGMYPHIIEAYENTRP